MVAARPEPEAALPTPAFASPQPTRPASVSIFTITEAKDAILPESVVVGRSGGMGTCTHVARTLVIFMAVADSMRSDDPALAAARLGHRALGRQGAAGASPDGGGRDGAQHAGSTEGKGGTPDALAEMRSH